MPLFFVSFERTILFSVKRYLDPLPLPPSMRFNLSRGEVTQNDYEAVNGRSMIHSEPLLCSLCTPYILDT